MRNNLNQLLLTEVNDKLTDVQQKAQWQSEVDKWFNGWETIRVQDNYIIEERVIPIPIETFLQYIKK
tara:strand:+ start:1700 stop:1900 length:201 start_codon:yes stop_codon:yes gene_type:complete